MPVDAVIFDIGGVLEITPATGWQGRWSARLELPREQLERRLAPAFEAGSTGRLALPEVERAIATSLKLDEAGLRELMEELWTEYLGRLNGAMANYFARLRPRYRTAILSNSFVGAREREERLYGFGDMCDVLVYSHEEGVAKPDPALYRIVCDRLGCPPGRCVLVDDTQPCIDGALAVGMQAVRFIDTAQAIRDLDQLLGDGSRH